MNWSALWHYGWPGFWLGFAAAWLISMLLERRRIVRLVRDLRAIQDS